MNFVMEFLSLYLWYEFLISLLILTLAMVAHELTHSIIQEKYDPPEFRLKWWKRLKIAHDCGNMSPQNFKVVLISGVIAGLPIIGLSFLIDPFASFMAFLGYMIGSYSDIKTFFT